MDSKIVNLLNDQITKEFYSGYLYLSMANYFHFESLDGFGKWYDIQAKEEIDHGKKIIKYLVDNDERVIPGPIDAPKWEFANFREPIEMALKHEQYVTGLINTLYGAAKELKDYRSCQFLDWYIAEQTEEEKNAHDLLTRFDRYAGDPRGLFLLDESLGTRTYTPLAGLE